VELLGVAAVAVAVLVLLAVRVFLTDSRMMSAVASVVSAYLPALQEAL
jgi:hypothetical protein